VLNVPSEEELEIVPSLHINHLTQKHQAKQFQSSATGVMNIKHLHKESSKNFSFTNLFLRNKNKDKNSKDLVPYRMTKINFDENPTPSLGL
jgi:hypothetical protein